MNIFKKYDCINYHIFYHDIKDTLDDVDILFIEDVYYLNNNLLQYEYKTVYVSNELINNSLINSSINCIDHLLRPIQQVSVERLMSKYYFKYNTFNRKFYVYNNQFSLDLDNIYYFENYYKKIKIITKDGVYHTNSNLYPYEKFLSKNNFYRVHNSYLVNLNKIELHERYKIILLTKDKIPIAKRRYNKFIDYYERHRLLIAINKKTNPIVSFLDK